MQNPFGVFPLRLYIFFFVLYSVKIIIFQCKKYFNYKNAIKIWRIRFIRFKAIRLSVNYGTYQLHVYILYLLSNTK